MATSFQPETPHEPDRGGRSYASIIVAAVLILLVLVMIVTLVLPRL